MPHCIIEYSSDLENGIVSTVIQTINEILIASDLFDPRTIKVRALPFSKYLTGGETKSFVHVTLKLLSGRTEELRSQLSQDILDLLINTFKSVEKISVDIVEMNRNCYKKI